jgi:hypothetical protein
VGPLACREGSGGGREVELARGLRHETSLKMKREEKGWRVDGKAAGGLRLYNLASGAGLADGGRADAIPNAAGGEGGHGAARPDGVIHRYIFNQKKKEQNTQAGSGRLLGPPPVQRALPTFSTKTVPFTTCAREQRLDPI